MSAELRARDSSLGLGSAGPLVSAAQEAASPSIAPDTGRATLDIECDAVGGNITASVVSVSAERGQWNDVARELIRLLASKKLRVPKGARGLRTRLEILAERVLPSGEHVETHAGAVPDDVPGSDPQCVGKGLERKCIAGMPVGATGQLADLTNVGAKHSRVLRVRVLGETPL